MKTIRLILGDQLDLQHSWFKIIDDEIVYVMIELRQETDYVWHHIQKITAFFAAMRNFANELKELGHKVIYIQLCDNGNQQNFADNLDQLIEQYSIVHFEYQLPDEYRLDEYFKLYVKSLSISHTVVDSEHFLSTRYELKSFFEGKKTFLMESFYHYMRKKNKVLMDGDEPVTGRWNYDAENRKKLPANHTPTRPLTFNNDIADIVADIKKTDIITIGTIDVNDFVWPINRKQSLLLLDFFAAECLPLFGTFQDAMTPNAWSLYHSRLSFCMNSKMLSPLEVIEKCIATWRANTTAITYNQLEGYVRQVIGWREYMRGMYWLKMPDFEKENYFDHQSKLPSWYWTGKTKMNCLKHAIGQSLHYAYAHHIQRLMITGNFALLAGTHPDEVDQWYLGIYIDAIQWVEITNTRGMSQFADGGDIGTKPYVSSAAYIDKMSHYCKSCYYDKAKKSGAKACPFNSLYWNFYNKHEKLLRGNQRIGMMYKIWDKMEPATKTALLQQADFYLKHIEEL